MRWPNFTRDEFACKCGCGTNEVDDQVIDKAQEYRTALGFALPVTSGYRCPKHPVEARKSKPGTHAAGLAVDFGIRGDRARQLLKLVMTDPGIQGIGINQKGAQRFIHIDLAPDRSGLIWTY